MTQDPARHQPDPGDTARIDRRRGVLAQLEAALLADKLALEEKRDRATGTDPYNSVASSMHDSGVWNTKRPR